MRLWRARAKVSSVALAELALNLPQGVREAGGAAASARAAPGSVAQLGAHRAGAVERQGYAG